MRRPSKPQPPDAAERSPLDCVVGHHRTPVAVAADLRPGDPHHVAANLADAEPVVAGDGQPVAALRDRAVLADAGERWLVARGRGEEQEECGEEIHDRLSP